MCHVLIIEDEAMIALSIEAALEDAGASSFDIVATEDAAVEAARRRRPDLITSDVQLLAGTGPQAVRTIRLELGDIPVIFITGTPNDCRPCSPPGSILTKPFQTAALAHAYQLAVH